MNPTKEEWQIQLLEYAVLANLTNRIRNQQDGVFKKKWEMFTEYLKNYAKQDKVLAGLI